MVLSIAVLGPLEVLVDGQPVDLRGGRQRRLLAALVLGRRTVVSADRLIDAVFGGAPSDPAGARNSLQTCMTRLRQSLGPAARHIHTRPAGYLLEVAADEVDADRFTALLDGGPRDALDRLDRALALWRGPAYPELADGPAHPEVARLEELRRVAEEERIEALLTAGRCADAVASAAALAAAEPGRDRAVRLLVRGLAASGRTADALAAYRRHRDWLREELGLDPSPRLRALHAEVLRTGPVEPGSTLIGRERELAAAGDLLVTSRMVTFVGPGGVGKTRLARALRPRWWVDLAALTDPAAVPLAVAAAVGLRPQPGVREDEALRAWAEGADGVLVLDNCEHLVAAAAALASTVVGRRLRILATSRERLGVDGERLFVVDPLAPGPAVRLFVARAREVAPGLRPDGRLLDRIGAVCAALDGLPLAIELAAARVGTVTVDDLADRIDARFALLDAPRRGGDRRHQTLRAMVDWSYGLLSEVERLLFARLHVFAAGFDLAAAEAVAGFGDVPPQRVPHLVALLTDRSMLVRPGHAGVGRYRMLESLRAYAAELPSTVELEEVRLRHAEYFTGLMERADAGLRGPDEASWVSIVDNALADARAAWSWACRSGQVDLAVRIAAAVRHYAYWWLRTDLLAWGEWTVSAAPEHPLAPAGFAAAATAAWIGGRVDEARDLARRGTRVAGADPRALASAWESVGDVGTVSGDLVLAGEAFREQARLVTDDAGRSGVLSNEAMRLAYGGDPSAVGVADRAIEAARACGSPSTLAMAYLARAEALGDGDPAAAVDVLAEARRLAESVGCRFVTGLALSATVAIRGRHGPPGPAFDLFRETLAHWRAVGDRLLLLVALRGLLVLFARTGRDAESAELAATLHHSAPTRPYGSDAERIETALAAVHSRLTPNAFDAAWASGAARTIDEAADHALTLLRVR